MHAEEDCPSQSEFIKKFLELEEDNIAKLKVYKILAKDYHVFMRTLPLNFKNLEQKIFEELNNIRHFELGIGKILKVIS